MNIAKRIKTDIDKRIKEKGGSGTVTGIFELTPDELIYICRKNEFTDPGWQMAIDYTTKRLIVRHTKIKQPASGKTL